MRYFLRGFGIMVAGLGLSACEPNTFYWHQSRNLADTAPDIVRAQQILEKDLSQCVVETNAQNDLAKVNTPVSVPRSAVVDGGGAPRAVAGLPTVYKLSDCMARRGWVKLDHYYTVPY